MEWEHSNVSWNKHLWLWCLQFWTPPLISWDLLRCKKYTSLSAGRKWLTRSANVGESDGQRCVRWGPESAAMVRWLLAPMSVALRWLWSRPLCRSLRASSNSPRSSNRRRSGATEADLGNAPPVTVLEKDFRFFSCFDNSYLLFFLEVISFAWKVESRTTRRGGHKLWLFLGNGDFLQGFWTLSAVINNIWEPTDFWDFLDFILYWNWGTILRPVYDIIEAYSATKDLLKE